MPHGRRYTNGELRSYCLKYITYLNERQLTNDVVTKEKLRDTYRRDYKPNVSEHTPSFATVMYNMKRFSMVSMRDKEYVKFMSKYKKSNVSISDISSQPSTPSEASSKSPGISPAKSPVKSPNKALTKSPRVSVSVDQHVAMRQIKTVAVGGLGDGNKLQPPDKLLCRVCNIYATSPTSMIEHKRGRRHTANCMKFLVDLRKSTYTSNNYGILISADGTTLNEEEGKLELQLPQGQKKRLNLEVINQGEETVLLVQCDMLQRHKSCTLDDPKGITVGSKTSAELTPGNTYAILVTCSVTFVGYDIIPIVFGFKTKQSEKQFFLLRQLVLLTETELMKELKPVSPYKAPLRAAVKIDAEVEPGLKIGSDYVSDELKQMIPLKGYVIPALLQTLANHGLKPFNGINSSQEQELKQIMVLLENSLAADNYRRRFQLLLHLEEIQMNVDIRQYDLKESKLEEIKEKPHLLALDVPGLAENRPSVLVGDRLYVCEVGSTAKREYEGYVHYVRETQVWLGFSKSFRKRFISGTSYNVRFTFSRRPMRLQHQAVSLADDLDFTNLLFPQLSSCAVTNLSGSGLPLFNRLLSSNPLQQQAVEAIVARTSGSAPYLIFGPPGTGKTVTIIEAMMQVWKRYPNCHILASASSNSAADLLAERLLVVVPATQILRMLALSRNWSSVPEKVKPCCNYDDCTGKYVYPSQEVIMSYRIVVTTLVTAGRLVGAKFPSTHFTHIFIDEAGHAVESETLIAVAGILSPGGATPCGQLVMAGDPKQLGPVLRSPFAIKYGLDVSYLERLMSSCDLYKRFNYSDDIDEPMYNPSVITKLLSNYRSHPDILQIPNELFYDNELKACADMLPRNVLAQWETLPCKGCPILFHGVLGKDERESNSPSFFNVAEVQIVVNYVQDLLSTRSKGIKIMPKDIGIISPYNQQVRKLRKALQKIGSTTAKLKELQNKNPTHVKVGSTEEYQGQEKDVIIISTVRSNPDLLQMDSKFRLGFLRNPKRFNVALTRAKALLIVVGNPHVLKLDANWNRFLEFCLERKAYVGTPFHPSDDDDDIIERMKLLSISQDEAMTATESMLPYSTELQWRTEV